MKSKKIKIFTDGSCIGNPGPGGFATIIKYQNITKIFKAGYQMTTNNRMELIAIIKALENVTHAHNILIYTDSTYIKLGTTKWIKNWKKNGWKNSKHKTIKNLDLWQKINLLIQNNKITWNWIKSHNGNTNNEHCDKLAKIAAKNPKNIDTGYIMQNTT
ncbi:MAG: ribonuclease HI [Candidatus Westeberhardia cardiocondylae]|nr:ribonuclease HI [Candidatus Westeberhardia cardiocondylae]